MSRNKKGERLTINKKARTFCTFVWFAFILCQQFDASAQLCVVSSFCICVNILIYLYILGLIY